MGMFIKGSYFFTIVDNNINKSPSQIMFNIGLNYKAVLLQGIEIFGGWAAHPQFFREYPFPWASNDRRNENLSYATITL